METIDPQGVGPNYNKDDYKKAQQQGWELLQSLRSSIKPGMNEKDIHKIYKDLLKDAGLSKSWHPPKIRLGPNSIKSFREISDEDYQIKENDIFFLDIGPLINGYEADVGQTFILGTQPLPVHAKIISDGEEIFKMTKDQFEKNDLTGPELYAFAEAEATKRGWELIGDGANGHRVGDFPHQGFYKGNLRKFPHKLVPGVWILEIQLRSPDHTFGAFYEDVL